MTVQRRRVGIRTERGDAGTSPIRLDLVSNPYGPTEHVGSLLATGAGNRDLETLAAGLYQRISEFTGLPARQLFLTGRIDDLVAGWLAQAPSNAPVILFPPGVGPFSVGAARRVIDVHRGGGFQPDLDAETASELPPDGIAILQSPHDPSGALAPAADVVRLARACSLVILDQRHGGYTQRSLGALAREFDNVVVLDTLETWGGLEGFPIGWAAGSPATLERLGGTGVPASGSLLAGLAVFEDLRNVLGAARKVRDERSRLFRMLRKLNLVQPEPSWANFLLARVMRGERDGIVEGLAQRGILVHAPMEPGMERFIRISAGMPEQTDALRRALVEIAIGIE